MVSTLPKHVGAESMKAGRPSSTALLIAQSTVVMGADPELGQLVRPEAAYLCGEFIRDHRFLGGLKLALYRQSWYRRAAKFWENLTLPGIQLHYALRKRCIELWVRRQLESGVSQLLVLGAGFDTLAQRLASEHGGLRCLELDHPSTQLAKKDSLARRGLVPSGLSFTPLDLSGSLDGLAESLQGLDPGARTAVVIEGLFMYLKEHEVAEILIVLQKYFGSRISIAFTYMEPDSEGKLRFHGSSIFVDAWLTWKREPFVWGLQREEVGVFLGECGLRGLEVLDSEGLRSGYPAEVRSLKIAEGERVCFAESRR